MNSVKITFKGFGQFLRSRYFKEHFPPDYRAGPYSYQVRRIPSQRFFVPNLIIIGAAWYSATKKFAGK